MAQQYYSEFHNKGIMRDAIEVFEKFSGADKRFSAAEYIKMNAFLKSSADKLLISESEGNGSNVTLEDEHL